LLQPRILKLALKSFFSRPFTTRFPYEPYEPIPQFRGRPRYHKDDCIGCGACAEVCPSPCIDVVDDLTGPVPVRRLVEHLDACLCCGQCERYCTTEKGITMTNEWDFAGFSTKDFEESVEKELLLCEDCGCVIAPVDQIRWLVKRLRPLAFANPTVMLVSHKELAVVDEGLTRPAGETTRPDRILILCPRCRRQTALVV
jgi:hydrogenase-4 component H